jgi:disulfide bond formation protein DsbB
MSTRILYFFGFIIVAILLLTSVYLQLFKGIEPCPLCALQRIVFGFLGFFFLAGFFLHAKRYARIFINVLCGLFSIGGMLLAGRQIWLQRFPSSDGSECGVSLQYMVQVLPLHEVLQKIIQGSTECAARGWEFLSLNMAEWAFIWFALFLLLTIYLFQRCK